MRIQVLALVVGSLTSTFSTSAPAAPSMLTPMQRETRLSAIAAFARQCHDDGPAMALHSCSVFALIVEDLLLLDGRFDARPAMAQVLTFTQTELKWDVARTAELAARLEALACALLQAEARGNLKALYVAEESYRAEYDSYSADQAALGFSPRSSTAPRYSYVVKTATPTAFLAVATGIGVAAGDVWELTEQNNMTNTHNVCALKTPTPAKK